MKVNRFFNIVLILASIVTVNVFGMEDPNQDTITPAPNPQKELTLSWGLSARQGDRDYMEDTYAAVTNFETPGFMDNAKKSFFAIFDGHGGKQAAEIAAGSMYTTFKDILNATQAREGFASNTQCLQDAFFAVDNLIELTDTDSGSTAVVAYILGDCAYIAWAGDSRAVVSDRHGQIKFVSQDHKPNVPAERQRIEDNGARVIVHGVPRVNGLAVSRALGDTYTKKLTPGAIIAKPNIQRIKDLQEDDIIILASDGVWDVVSNQEAAQIVRNNLASSKNMLNNSNLRAINCLARHDNLQKRDGSRDTESIDGYTHEVLAAQNLRDHAYARGSHDNISVLVIAVDKATLKNSAQAVANAMDNQARKECPVCFEEFAATDGQFRLTNCCKAFICAQDLQKVEQSNTKVCPLCREPNVSGVRVNVSNANQKCD